MKKTEAIKTFDCVRFKREAQARIYEQIKGLSPREEIEYFRNAASQGPFAEKWKAVIRRTCPSGKPV